ncbi:uncharacterized protein PG986_012464 [Apiospora aurea]|uniref:Secreted protein n=1 Tax=Apiospora aurea TaxID=335848 RepID=A0ABR1Q028_9PEZI
MHLLPRGGAAQTLGVVSTSAGAGASIPGFSSSSPPTHRLTPLSQWCRRCSGARLRTRVQDHGLMTGPWDCTCGGLCTDTPPSIVLRRGPSALDALKPAGTRTAGAGFGLEPESVGWRLGLWRYPLSAPQILRPSA